MIHNTVIKKLSGHPYKPQIRKIRRQSRNQIRRLLRTFEPLENFKKTDEAKP